MSSDNSADTAVAVRDSEDSYRPVLRWGRGQYVFPKESAIVSAKEAMKISLESFVSFMTTGTSPSRSPEKWKQFVSHNNYGVVKVDEGKFPYVVFDVEGHPQMKEVVHFIPIEPAAKLLPALHEMVKDDPEAYGIKVNSAKTPESRAKHQARLENLLWKPEDCMSSQNKSGILKPTQPNPMSNKWQHVPTAFQVKWCCAPEKDSKSVKKGSSKRKIGEVAESLPCGVRVKSDVDFPGISLMASIPVGTSYSTKVVDGQLQVIVYGSGASDDAPEAEEAEEAADDEE